MSETPAFTALLVEDDVRLAGLTRQYLESHGGIVSVCHDGLAALGEALYHDHDIVLLDLMLPGLDGTELCRRIRERKDVPIIMLTARGEEIDRVLGLELGADDYLAKPFSPRELLARIRAVLRRTRGQAGPSNRVVRVGELELDPASRSATLAGSPLDLTSYELSLLLALARHAGRVLERERLMELAGGNPEESFDRSVDVHVSRLRKKLGDDPRQPRFIRTVGGLGYVFLQPAAGGPEVG